MNNIQLKIAVTFFLLSSCFTSFSQEVVWEKKFMFPIKTEADSIATSQFIRQTSKGEFYLNYYTEDYHGSGLCKLDNNGFLEWQKLKRADSVWSSIIFDFWLNAFVNKNDECVFTGALLGTWGGFYLQRKINTKGDEIKQRLDTASSEWPFSGGDFFALPNEEVISSEWNDRDTGLVMKKLDTNAKTVWKKIIKDKGGYMLSGNLIVNRMNNGDFIIWAELEDDGRPIGSTAIFRTDSMGNQLWQYYIYHKDTVTNPISIVPTSDGNILFLAQLVYYGEYYTGTRTELIKATPEGKMLWLGDYEISDVKKYYEEVNTEGTCVAETKDGGFVIGGNAGGRLNDNERDIFFIRVDKEGKKLWQKRYGSESKKAFDGISDILVTPQNEIVASGIYEGRNLYAVKMKDIISSVTESKDFFRSILLELR